MASLPSLEVLTLRHFADSIIDEFLSIQAQYIERRIDLDEVVLRSKAVLSHWEGEIPSEGFRSALQNYIYDYASDIAFLFAIGMENKLYSFEVNSPSSTLSTSLPHATIVPQPIIECFLKNLSTNLTTLKLHGAYLNDDRFAILTSTVAAKNLRVLSLDRPFISDRSASLWLNFELLQELELIDALWMTLVSFKSICKLQNLSKIDIISPQDVKVADYLHFFELDSAPSLIDFRVENASGLSFVTLENLIDLLKKRPNRQNIRSLTMGQLPYESSCAEMFRLCPNLERNSFFFTSLDMIESTGSSKNITHLHIRNLINGLTDADLRRLHELCPNLISLRLHHVEIKLQLESFNIFSGLKELQFFATSGIQNLTSYPSTLTNLLFDTCATSHSIDNEDFNTVEGSREGSEGPSANDQTARMLSKIIRDAPDLKRFCAFRTFKLRPKHVEMLYTGLQHASEIETSMYDALELDPSPFFCSSHSMERFRLHRWDGIIKGHVPRLLHLPALKELSLLPALQTRFQGDKYIIKLSNRYLPRLRCLELGYFESEVNQSDLEDQFRGIASLHRSLRHLHLHGDWKAFFTNSAHLSRLDRLQSLQLERIHNFVFSPSMSNLLYLELRRTSLPCWVDSAICFPHLHHLKFERVSIKGTISITAQQFPSLEIFQLISMSKSGLEIRDHPKLFIIVLDSLYDLSQLEIVRCTNLFHVSLCKIFGFFKAIVDENSKLSHINLNDVQVLSHSETKFQVSPVDAIKIVTSFSNSSAAIDLYKKIGECSHGRLISASCTLVNPGGNLEVPLST